MIEIRTENLRNEIPSLAAGDRVALTGDVYTARDAAHKRIFQLLDRGEALPFPIMDAVIYYVGPTPAPKGRVIGSAGPTTSGRMDAFAPRLLDLGLAGMIGKGERSEMVTDAIVRNCGIYLCAIGGAGALMARHITAIEEIAFPELGCESIKRLTVSGLPLIVGIDCHGSEIFVKTMPIQSQAL